MIIQRLSASFGKLSNETLHLAPGLNIIEAPNESGKSTWCAFIRTMFYGIKTSDRDKQGYLSDKTRFRPWSGAPMAGSMDIVTGGSAITIERVSSGKLPLKDFSAVYAGTGTPAAGLFPDTAGETLLGVDETVFERSAFISQAGIKICQTPELEKRISALVSTGDETSSYTVSDERLRLWLRKRRFNKSGTIPALEEKLAAVTRKLSEIEAARDETADMRLEGERLKKYETELKAELKAADDYEAGVQYRRALEKLDLARNGYNAVCTELTKNGPAPSPDDISSIRGDLKALEPLKKMMAEQQLRLEEARRAYAKLLDEKQTSPFGGTDASGVLTQAASLERQIKSLSPGSPLSIILILLTVAAVVLTALLPAVRLPAGAAALLLAVILLARAALLASVRKKLAGYLSGFRAGAAADLKKLIEEDNRLSGALAASDSDVIAGERAAASAAVSVDTVLQNLLDRLGSLSLTTDLERLDSVLVRFDALYARLSAAKSEISAAESFLKAVEESGTYGSQAQSGAPIPARSRKEIVAELSAVSSRLEALAGRYNMALGEIRAMGDPAILSTEKKSAEAELAVQKTQFEALTIAIDALKTASVELQTRFSPLLSDTAGKIIRHMTAGRYEKLAFDKSLDALAKTPDETVSRNILTLSAGTADQIYLALRLAVVELLLKGPEPCPLIIDDALSNFDNSRISLALDYLHELASTRQILLFTCHSREAAHFSGCADVNIIELK